NREGRQILPGRGPSAAGAKSSHEAVAPAPNPNLGQLQFWVTPEGSSQYHSLQVGLNRRFGSGLQLQTSYTYAKNTSNADGVFGRYLDISGTVPQDPDDWRADWGLAGIDIRNYFSFNYTYD